MTSPAGVVATAPVRVADVGGWTDTWFGAPGRVCHLAVGPGVRVEARLVATGDSGPAAPLRLVARPLGVDQWVGPSAEGGWARPRPGVHPLLEHAAAAILEADPVAEGRAVEVVIDSAVPPGASLGTSAAVVVAMLGALDVLLAGGRRTPEDVARLAHEVETGRAGREAGVQDQWAAALGGCGLVAVGPYPEARHLPVAVSPGVSAELGERLVTVVFGAHDSSLVHGEVIAALTSCDGGDHDRARGALRRLSVLAGEAADALTAGDVAGWAGVLTAATAEQARLHPSLVGRPHVRAAEVAAAQGAAGWKVNGAGGDGGSLTAVAAPGGASALREALAAAGPTWQLVDLAPAPGLTVVPVDPRDHADVLA
jgi:D-glycero-alpha-D-manno-heptose-7-phosphate kinase